MNNTSTQEHDFGLVHSGPNSRTRKVPVGDIIIGGGSPVSVQSMLNTKTTDFKTSKTQLDSLYEAGCEIIRVAIPNARALDGFQQICEYSPIPVVADIHFDYLLAVEAARRGASKLRINPGNIGSMDKVDAVIDAAGSNNCAIRIGVNAGSLEPRIAEMQGMSHPDKLVASALEYVSHFESKGFKNIVLSAKAHDVATTVETYRRLSHSVPLVPLHLGVTEAGTLTQGTVKSAAALGILLGEGIGDTMRVSLTADPVQEILVAWNILSSLGLRRRGPEIVSCPTCGRCQVDMVPIAEEVSKRLSKLKIPISIAVMGCIVNGPGEAKEADIGVACGKESAVLFVEGEVLRKVTEDQIVDELFKEIEDRYLDK